MKKKIKLIVIPLILLMILTGYGIWRHYIFLNNEVTIKNNVLSSSLLPDDNFTSSYKAKLNFDDMSISKVSGVTFNILNDHNIKNIPVLLKSQRYYIPLSYISNKLGYKTLYNDELYSIISDSNKILVNANSNSFTKNEKTGHLRGNILFKDNEPYISISDIEELFNLFAEFDFDANSITLLNNEVKTPTPQTLEDGKNIALFRFEDFTCGDSNFVDKNQTKIKIMGDYLFSQGIKFHLGWIPRFKAPTDGIDNDLLTNNNITNVGFINLLDYLINKGCEIGLHGYTHQHDDERSAVGEEMSKNVNSDEKSTREVIENGIDTASALNIPISFYESPHYRDTHLQQKIIGDYFRYIYEPYDNSKKNIYKSEEGSLFVPTPLGFVENGSSASITNGLASKDKSVLKSFFYHPSIEIDYIDFNTDNNKLNYTISDDSPMKTIVNSIKNNNCVTIHVDELKKSDN
ncbi:DUF2334 domain-containing protein [Clostridium sp. SHJSY1]|uniref:DUF2334 domain-containing protein n=1 Tax=Clostridium sp. SHJSY1 TaxID=2942483 RepID=UPI00287683ED|nr:DUF2334 domain-containing protein [Clostridium sp. SHJSY1]MDS0524750.1 DUF2334 domain-containing protein [Clostridium sp. SHJSY1]